MQNNGIAATGEGDSAFYDGAASDDHTLAAAAAAAAASGSSASDSSAIAEFYKLPPQERRRLKRLVHPSKRKRIAVACDSCKRRKQKVF